MRRIFLSLFCVVVLTPPSPGQWEKLNFPNPYIFTLLTTQQGLIASGGRSLYLSRDNGSTWDSLSYIGISVPELVEVGSVLLIASSYARTPEDLSPFPCVFRSENGGRSWDTVMEGVFGVQSIVLAGSTLYANPDGQLFSSVDTGKTWTRVDTTGEFPDLIAGIIADGSTIYLRIQAERLYRSTDGGTTWDSLSPGIPSSYYNVLAHDSSIYVGAHYGPLYASSDRGDSWQIVSSGLPDSSGFRKLFLVENHMLAAVSRNLIQTVYQFDLSGTLWERFDTGLSFDQFAYIIDFASNNSYIFLAAGSSLWRRPLSDLVTHVKEPPASLPARFNLEQNYPNPFNPSTNIRYGLPHKSAVHLTVFNTLGQQVATLVQGEKDAGYHEVMFDGTGLSSGVYFYKMTAGDYVATKKLLILK